MPQPVLDPARPPPTLQRSSDFGCAAKAGEETAILFTPRYAPPEVIHTVAAHNRRMAVSPAVDSWALGVIAWELLTGSEALALMEVPQLWACLVGQERLPWEREGGMPVNVAPAFAECALVAGAGVGRTGVAGGASERLRALEGDCWCRARAERCRCSL